MDRELLRINDLKVSFSPAPRIFSRLRGAGIPPRIHAVRGLNLSVRRGELHALVGESGSGKSVSSAAVMGLLPVPPARIDGGSIFFKGSDLLAQSADRLRALRGREIGMIFQEPARYLNPVFTIGSQIAEMIRFHFKQDRAVVRERCLASLQQAGLSNPERIMRAYPHELSGGMKQRAMIALAMCCDPSLLIADEPTTALDMSLQYQILKLILGIRDDKAMGVLFISHDLRLVRGISDTVSVIYAGKIAETAAKDVFFSRPLHPYSVLLLGAIPDARKRGTPLAAVRGKIPDPARIPLGCAFHPRCPRAKDICSRIEPELTEYEPGHGAACHNPEGR